MMPFACYAGRVAQSAEVANEWAELCRKQQHQAISESAGDPNKETAIGASAMMSAHALSGVISRVLDFALAAGETVELKSMALRFPNNSRSYDTTRRAVRFWGYDSAMEASFFVTEDALRQIQPGMALDQDGALRVFDVNRPLIYATAAKVYARAHKGSYDLVSSDF
jgi:hypothetical protein